VKIDGLNIELRNNLRGQNQRQFVLEENKKSTNSYQGQNRRQYVLDIMNKRKETPAYNSRFAKAGV
jgi:hypothetical protein